MEHTALLVDAFDRIRELVEHVVDGLGDDQLRYQVDAEANTIAWLVWHLTRVQDDHIADAAQTEQVWTAQGWDDRFGLPFASSATGYGHDPDDVAAVRGLSADLLVGYSDAVHAQTTSYLAGLSTADLDRVVDTAWDPPVTLGVRLVSVITDDLQHIGQAAMVRGVVQRLSS